MSSPAGGTFDSSRYIKSTVLKISAATVALLRSTCMSWFLLVKKPGPDGNSKEVDEEGV